MGKSNLYRICIPNTPRMNWCSSVIWRLSDFKCKGCWNGDSDGANYAKHRLAKGSRHRLLASIMNSTLLYTALICSSALCKNAHTWSEIPFLHNWKGSAKGRLDHKEARPWDFYITLFYILVSLWIEWVPICSPARSEENIEHVAYNCLRFNEERRQGTNLGTGEYYRSHTVV